MDREWIVAKSVDGKGDVKFALTIDRERPAVTARTALAPGTSLLDAEFLTKLSLATKLTEAELLAMIGVVDERSVKGEPIGYVKPIKKEPFAEQPIEGEPKAK